VVTEPGQPLEGQVAEVHLAALGQPPEPEPVGDHQAVEPVILWNIDVLFDELVRQRIVTPQKVARALEKMRVMGSRLPRAECERRLRKWGRRDG